jgi:hypothetical protein
MRSTALVRPALVLLALVSACTPSTEPESATAEGTSLAAMYASPTMTPLPDPQSAGYGSLLPGGINNRNEVVVRLQRGLTAPKPVRLTLVKMPAGKFLPVAGDFGGYSTYAIDVSDNQSILGVYQEPTGRLFRVWADGRVDTLLTGSPCGTPSINLVGDIVGCTRLRAGYPEAIVWRASGALVYLADVVPLPADWSGTRSQATDINDAGDILIVGGPSMNASVVWNPSAGVVATLPFAGKILNRKREVVGSRGDYAATEYVHWHKRSGITVLPFTPIALNDPGTVAGSSLDGIVVWSRAEPTVRLVVPGPAQAIDMNNRGTIVGYMDGQPVVWIF